MDPFQTYLVYSSLALALVFGGFSAYRWRMKRMRSLADRLQALVEERTATLERLNQELQRLTATDGLTGVVTDDEVAAVLGSTDDMDEVCRLLIEMARAGDMAGLLAFTRMTGDLIKAMRSCPQPIISAIEGVCAGATTPHHCVMS